MRYEPTPPDTRFTSIALSQKARRITAAAGRAGATVRAASISEMHHVVGEARKTLDLATDAAIEAVMEVNPSIIQLIEFPDRPDKIAFIAQIPLNEAGALAVVNDRFDGSRPDPAHVQPRGLAPAAIYVWLIYTPGVLGRAMGGIEQLLDTLSPTGCALFTKAVTAHTSRLFPAMGFIPACSVYPDAPDGLLVVLPEQASGTPSVKSKKPTRVSTVRIARTMEDLARVFSVRAATYIADQLCPYEEEFDGNDLCATQLMGEIDGEPVGCLRIRYFATFAKIERLAIRKEFRTSKLSFQIVRYALNHCREKGYSRVYGHSRTDLVRFWQTFGFREIPGREPFWFSDVEYREVVLDLSPCDTAITMDHDPMVIIRPEGAWSEQGPLDRSRLRALPSLVKSRPARRSAARGTQTWTGVPGD